MSRQRKQLCFAVMIVGAVALIVDRCVLTEGVAGPSASLAAVGAFEEPRAARPGESDRAARPPETQETALSIPELPFPRGLKPFDPAKDIRDLFAPPVRDGDSGPESSATDKHGARSHGAPGPVSSATFVTQHRLNGVMNDQRLKIAIVDGKWVQLGQVIDECRLVGLEGTKAHFECFDGEAVLDLPGGG